MMVATPMPPPMHSVTRARRALRRSSSSTMVPVIMAPVAPSGWPIAMAPPLTLSFSSGMFRSFWNFSTTDANASLISTRSMSSRVRPARSSTLRVAGVGPVSMMTGSAPLVAVATTRAGGVRTDQHQRGAVDNAGAVAAGVHVVDLLDEVVLLQRHVVEAAHLADTVERGLELAQAFQGGVGTHVLIVVEDHQAVLVAHRDHRLGEVAARPGRGGLLLAAQGKAVDVVAGEALDGRDQVGTDALRHEPDRIVGFRVQRPRAAVGAHRHPAHRLHATGEHQVVPAGTHLLRGQVNRLQARRAEP